jgi:hypothetical protein
MGPPILNLGSRLVVITLSGTTGPRSVASLTPLTPMSQSYCAVTFKVQIQYNSTCPD